MNFESIHDDWEIIGMIYWGKDIADLEGRRIA